MTKLSVNINKFGTLRNARGGNNPDIQEAAIRCESFGADGITVHPRPDQRHIRYSDIPLLKKVVTTEFNIEGNPTPDFIRLVCDNRPTQVTLVPDAPDALTSNAGWDTRKHKDFLKEVIQLFHEHGIRTSIFLDPQPDLVAHAKETGTDRIELYTESYAVGFLQDPSRAIEPYRITAEACLAAELGINAGHDLDLHNLNYFYRNIPGLLEVSIGHALICDAIYLGLNNVVKMYKARLKEDFHL